MDIRTKNHAEMLSFAKDFVRKLAPRENGATVVALYGDLGSGKTTFVQGAAKALDVDATIISPTFVIERVYKLKNQSYDHLIHIDCYRIDASKEIAFLGWNEKIANPKNLIFVEWAERVEYILPKDATRVYFEVTGETERSITIKNTKHRHAQNTNKSQSTGY